MPRKQKAESQRTLYLTAELRKKVDQIRQGAESRIDCIRRLVEEQHEMLYGEDAEESAKWSALRMKYRIVRGHWPEEEKWR